VIKHLHIIFSLKPLLFVLSSFCCLFVAASEKELDPVQVNAALNSSTYSPYDFIGSHELLDLDYYQDNFMNLGDILNLQTGIDIQSVSGVGQYATPIIRGAEGKQVLVFNNGIALNDLNGGSADIGNISLVGAERIEIYRGLVPMELAPTAIGGAINIIPKMKKGSNGSAGFSLGTYGVNQLFLSQEYSTDKLNLQVNIDRLNADNNFIYEEKQPVSSPSTPKNEQRYNNGIANLHISSTMNYTQSNYHKISSYISLNKSEREIPGIINTPNNHADIVTNSLSLQIDHQHSINKHSFIKSSYSITQSHTIFDDTGNNIGLGSQHNQYDTLHNKYNITYKKHFDNLNLILNQQFQNETLNSYFLNDPQSSFESCVKNMQCDSEFNRQQFSSGVRLEWQPQSALSTNIQVVHLNNKDDAFSNESNKINKDFTSIVTAISYHLENGLVLSSNLSKQIRSPSTSELYGDLGTTIGNPELLPEKSNSLEIGISKQHENYDISLYSFYREVKDNISAQQDSRGVIKYSNIAETQFKGLELSVNKRFWNKIYYALNLTFQKGLIIDHWLNSFKGNVVPDQRSQLINQSLDYKSSWWSLKLTSQIESGGYYDTSNFIERKTNKLWNASASIKYRATTLSIQGNNLGNSRIRDYPLTPASGRTFYLKLTKKW